MGVVPELSQDVVLVLSSSCALYGISLSRVYVGIACFGSLWIPITGEMSL